MLLDDKNAVIYGGGGAIGGAMARTFALEGANVFLAGRTAGPLEKVAADIRAAGGSVEHAIVDALDEAAVEQHVAAVVASAGRLDISFNLISTGDVQGTPLVDMSLADFEAPVVNRVRTQFITSRAAAKPMIEQGAGVILTVGGSGLRDPLRDFVSGGHQFYLGGTQVSFGAIDVLRRQLANELGPHGIRVVTLESAGFPETVDASWRDMMAEGFRATSMLRQVETLDDAANVAAFAASDLARSMTATSFNITYGRVAN